MVMMMMRSPLQPSPQNEMGGDHHHHHHHDSKVIPLIVESTTGYAVQLAKLYDVSMVDSYLLQTYIVPHVIDALQQILLPFLSFYRTQQKLRHQHHEDSNTDANVSDASIIPESLLPRLVRCVVPFFTLLWTGGLTPAMRQMNLQFQSITNRLPVETKTGNIQSKLFLYAIVQYIIPELLYPLLRYYIQSKMKHIATTTLSGVSTVRGEQNRLTHPQPPPQAPHFVPNDPTIVKKRRQYLMLQWLQSMLHHVDTKVIPTVQFLILLRCWSGTATTTMTSMTQPSLPMILAGLTYINTTTTAMMMMVPPESPPALFYLDLAHRRWFTHHLWETIGTILLPSIRANIVSSPHALLSHTLLSHIQQVVHRFRTLVQGTVASMVAPPLWSIPTTRQDKDISVRPQQQHGNNNTTTTTTCPLCEQIPPTMALRASCPTCRNQQMYCYACFYQHYGMDDRQRHPDENFDKEKVDDDDDDAKPTHSVCGSSRSSGSRRRRYTTEVGSEPHVVPATQVSYRILLRERSTNLHCRVCHMAMDTVSFGHPTQ